MMTREAQAVRSIEELAQQLEAFSRVKRQARIIAEDHAWKVIHRAIDSLYAIAKEQNYGNCREILHEAIDAYLARFCEKARELAAYYVIWVTSEDNN